MENGPIEGALQDISANRQKIAGNENADILTDRRQILSNENLEPPFRSPTNRLIRGSIAYALAYLRDNPQVTGENRQVVYDFAKKQREMTVKLDQLDLQYKNNGRLVEDGLGGHIYASTLDLQEKKEGEEDTRVPWVMIGGSTSTSEANASLPIALALSGEKVTILTYPEQMQLQAGKRSFMDKIRNAKKGDLLKFSNAIKNLGERKINLIGHSLGGAFVLALASDNSFVSSVEINDVISLAPGGFTKRNMLSLGKGFGREDVNVRRDPEMKASIYDQGVVDANRPSAMGNPGNLIQTAGFLLNFLSTGRATATRFINSQVVENAAQNVTGDIEVWTASKDSIIKEDEVHKAVENVAERHPGKVASYTLEGTHNTFFTNAFGFVRHRSLERDRRHKEKTPVQKKEIDANDLERSGAEFLLKEMQGNA